MALWDGRFSGGPGEEMLAFSESMGVDLRMYREDIRGSVAHATMLAEVGLISDEERARLLDGLGRVLAELDDGSWRPGPEHEDIHMAVEARLGEHVGAVAGKLHTARSRNDQVATDVRLWMKGGIARLDGTLRRLLTALLDRTEADGFTALSPEVLAQHHPLLDEGALAWLDPEAAAERRRSLGGTAWSEVQRQLTLLRATLEP